MFISVTVGIALTTTWHTLWRHALEELLCDNPHNSLSIGICGGSQSPQAECCLADCSILVPRGSKMPASGPFAGRLAASGGRLQGQSRRMHIYKRTKLLDLHGTDGTVQTEKLRKKLEAEQCNRLMKIFPSASGSPFPDLPCPSWPSWSDPPGSRWLSPFRHGNPPRTGDLLQ